MDISDIPHEIHKKWHEARIPFIVRSGVPGQKLTAKLPFKPDNFAWIKSLAKGNRKPEVSWDATTKTWALPVSWLNRFVDNGLARYGQLYVVQPFREMEKCAPACRNALGHDCECSCMGENHGAGNGLGWFDVSEAYSFRWGPQSAAARLMTTKM
ncbi:hypothetical protein EYC08_20715 [Tabrizicola sp. WMC-M-20]|nr:hypothetical protein EYC08_20715 [Tabrizicola sp. WMC-M-20]